jgi:hypothetical protein
MLRKEASLRQFLLDPLANVASYRERVVILGSG